MGIPGSPRSWFCRPLWCRRARVRGNARAQIAGAQICTIQPLRTSQGLPCGEQVTAVFPGAALLSFLQRARTLRRDGKLVFPGRRSPVAGVNCEADFGRRVSRRMV
jgi:hypothetical protein